MTPRAMTPTSGQRIRTAWGACMRSGVVEKTTARNPCAALVNPIQHIAGSGKMTIPNSSFQSSQLSSMTKKGKPMSEQIKIVELHIENFKKVVLVKMGFNQDGLTIIGGGNRQGKTTVLDAICFALGGSRMKPSSPKRDGAEGDPYIRILLSNGLEVIRKGKNSDLTVRDPKGMKAGQELLSAFIDELALIPRKFMQMNNPDKARTLLKVIGVQDRIDELDSMEKDCMAQRAAAANREKDAYARVKAAPFFSDAPGEPVSIRGLLDKMEEGNQHNAMIAESETAKQRAEEDHRLLKVRIDNLKEQREKLYSELAAIEADISEKERALGNAANEVKILDKDLAGKQKFDPAPLYEEIQAAHEVNKQVEANARRQELVDLHAEAMGERQAAELQIENLRTMKAALLESSAMPLPELKVVDGELLYNGKAWDCMSGIEQISTAAAIVKELRPECGFILLDELERYDLEELAKFAAWAEEQKLQIIATRVSAGDECSIIIEEGTVKED